MSKTEVARSAWRATSRGHCAENDFALCLLVDSPEARRWYVSVVRRPRLGARLRSLGTRHADVTLAVVLTALTQLEAWTIEASYLQAPRLPIALTTLAMSASVGWRRRAPLAVALVTAGALLVQLVLVHPPHSTSAPLLVWMVVVYSVAAHAPQRDAVFGGVAMVAAVDVWAIVHDGGNEFVFLTVILGGFWLVGRVVRSRNELAGALAKRTLELENEREERARLAVAVERSHIARELHDIVAHTLGVIVMQAGAERLHLHDDSPTCDAFASIESSGREALSEMGRLLGMLRSDGEGRELAPQPGLARLDALIDRVRTAGLDVELIVSGDPRELGPGADVSAYRILQEALTNTMRHGRAERARVRLSWEPCALEIEVADDGIGPPMKHGGTGHGLVCIRERVALYGGTLVVSRSELGGFRLCARLPAVVE